MADFYKIGLLTFRGDRFLMCRKDHFTSKLILPGGRVEPGESELECLNRELREELGDVAVDEPAFIGRYADIAHADDPLIVKTLELSLYAGNLRGEPLPLSEIVELVWFGPDSDVRELTPIFTNQILPDLKKRGLLPW